DRRPLGVLLDERLAILGIVDVCDHRAVALRRHGAGAVRKVGQRRERGGEDDLSQRISALVTVQACTSPSIGSMSHPAGTPFYKSDEPLMHPTPAGRAPQRKSA